jgi:hypothetical protein
MFCELLKAALTGSYEISYCGYIEYYENTGEFREVREGKDNLGWPYYCFCKNGCGIINIADGMKRLPIKV